MKSTRINIFAVLTTVVVALSSFGPVAVAAKNQEVLSKKELKVLLRTAKEPAEHRQIAEYYRQEAQWLYAKSKYHEEMGAIYEKSPLPYEGKFPYGTVGLSHCRRWAQLDAEQAKEAEALAALHEQMAREAEAGAAASKEVTDAALDVRSCTCRRGNSQELASAVGTKMFASLGK